MKILVCDVVKTEGFKVCMSEAVSVWHLYQANSPRKDILLLLLNNKIELQYDFHV